MSGRFVTEDPGRTETALADIGHERERQFSKWGPQHHPNGTSKLVYAPQRDFARAWCDRRAAGGHVTWSDILTEEYFEALAEENPYALRAELVQVAAVCAAWIEDLDR